MSEEATIQCRMDETAVNKHIRNDRHTKSELDDFESLSLVGTQNERKQSQRNLKNPNAMNAASSLWNFGTGSFSNAQPHHCATIRKYKGPRQSLRHKDGLIQYATNIRASQHGEDGILERIFEVLLPSPSYSGQSRYCVDVGAWDGKHLSNTYHLLVPPPSTDEEVALLITSLRPRLPRSKWKGILIEADVDRCHQMKHLHDPLGNVSLCQEVSCTVRERSLSNILSHFVARSEQNNHTGNNFPEEENTAANNSDSGHNSNDNTGFGNLPLDFDFLSIDVDGCDYWLLEDVLITPIRAQDDGETATTSFFRPKVIRVEFNPTIPHDIVYINPRNDQLRHGSSLAALVELAARHGYALIETTTYNAFFVPSEIYYKFIIQDLPWCMLQEQTCRPPTIEEVHEITMGTQLYQLYDGTLKLSGCQKLLWHRIPMDEDQIQMLPSKQRGAGSFPFAPPSSSSDTNPAMSNGSAGDPSMTAEEKGRDEDQYKYVRQMAVDLSSFCCLNGTPKEPPQREKEQRDCARQLMQQLQGQSGFVVVKGTGISRALCKEALRQTRRLLQDPNNGGEATEKVRRSALSRTDRARRGYSPPNTENFASLLDQGCQKDTMILCESFALDPWRWRDQ
jgi:hypothetical protein